MKFIMVWRRCFKCLLVYAFFLSAMWATNVCKAILPPQNQSLGHDKSENVSGPQPSFTKKDSKKFSDCILEINLARKEISEKCVIIDSKCYLRSSCAAKEDEQRCTTEDSRLSQKILLISKKPCGEKL